METALRTALAAALLAAVACGAGPRPDSSGPLEAARNSQQHDLRGRHTTDTPAGRKTEAEEMAAMPAPVSKFHATLAPYWHAKQGPQRMTDTCAAIGELKTGVDAILAAPPPERGDTAAWSAGGKRLADSVTALEGTCKTSDAPAFETALAQVHERFHGLMATANSDHDDHARDPSER